MARAGVGASIPTPAATAGAAQQAWGSASPTQPAVTHLAADPLYAKETDPWAQFGKTSPAPNNNSMAMPILL